MRGHGDGYDIEDDDDHAPMWSHLSLLSTQSQTPSLRLYSSLSRSRVRRPVKYLIAVERC